MFDNMYILHLIYRKKSLLLKSTLYELKSQYAGSSLGLLWILISPLILIAIYSIVYLYILKVKPDQVSTSSYVLYLISGLLLYLGFMQSIQKSSSSILQNKSAIFNTLYPIEFVPLRSVFASFIPAILGLSFLIVYKLVTGDFSLGLLKLPIILVFLMLFSIGIALIMSLLIIALKDVENILQYVFMILVFVTPIGFLVEQLPGNAKMLVYLNPLYYLINPIQKCIAFNSNPELLEMVCCSMIAFSAIYLGGKFFRSFKLTIFELI